MVDTPYFNSEQRWKRFIKIFVIALLLFIIFSMGFYVIFYERERERGIKIEADDSSPSLSFNHDSPKRHMDFNKFKECSKAPSTPQDRRIDHSRLSIVNYNCEWLFATGGSGSIKCPGIQCPWLSFAAAQDHISKIADIIQRLDADIVNLVEIQDCSILEMLMEHLPSNHGYKPYLLKGDDRATGQNMGLLTRVDPVIDLQRSKVKLGFPVKESRCKNQSNIGKSGLGKHYLTKFSIDNGRGSNVDIVMVGVHLLARPSDSRRCTRREAQALVLDEYIKKMSNDNNEIIIAGDFNDFDTDVDPIPIHANIDSSTMKIVKNIRNDLVNVVSHINDKNERYSAWYDRNRNCVDNGNREHELIDHIFVSKGLKVESVQFYHNYTMSCNPEERISDHWPLKAVLYLA